MTRFRKTSPFQTYTRDYIHFVTILVFLVSFNAQTVSAQGAGGYVYKQFQNPVRDRLIHGLFSSNFTWGVATSAYQIEGAWNEDQRGETIWDTFSHEPGRIVDNANGDIACNSYHKIDEDVALLKELQVKHYRFSIAWSRILPDGTLNKINQAGIVYYRRLINALVEAEIEPVVTLFHWDLPQALQDIGGWSNEILTVYFKNYAELCFLEYGDWVKRWITFNEPSIFAKAGHEHGVHAPGLKHQGTTVYRVAHTIIKAHAKVWHTYDNKYRASQKGQVGITLVSSWAQPSTKWQVDIMAAERYLQFEFGWFAHPLMVNGDYPSVMKTQILEKSIGQGLSSSRLPSFTEEEKVLLRGTVDFLGVNYYTTKLISAWRSDAWPPGYEEDQDLKAWHDESWPKSGASWQKCVPWGFRLLLNWVKHEYGNPPIYVTETGVAEKLNDQDEPKLKDVWRVQYFVSHINELLKAYKLDGVNVQGFSAWTLMDNFEWQDGYSTRFGLYHVDFKSPARTRTAKSSAKKYNEIVTGNGFPVPVSKLRYIPQFKPDMAFGAAPRAPMVPVFHDNDEGIQPEFR
ncbi:cytosolic beta-glucosidase-like [Saccoglossus kowalevskii]|uniref:Lactase-phlorizin hydrolase-like n=1 Tax=Saccoglossus kowalevskii TaxID=10224 RepID=A0ABM0ML43_SACKO|nr:PREDICTED: lactase-phlorizin hydrolase-like [Saccoglossus kowalevskii]